MSVLDSSAWLASFADEPTAPFCAGSTTGRLSAQHPISSATPLSRPLTGIQSSGASFRHDRPYGFHCFSSEHPPNH